MREIHIFMEGGVIQNVEGIPDDITIRMHGDGDESCLPEDRSDDDYAISISWNVADIKRRAKENGIEITTEQAIEILDCMAEKHGAEKGINWSIIDYYLEKLKRN